MLVRKHNPKNKIDDHYKAEIHVVIEKKHSNSVIYYVKGLETSIVKCYHQDHLILFKERDTFQSVSLCWHIMYVLPSLLTSRLASLLTSRLASLLTHNVCVDISVDITVDISAEPTIAWVLCMWRRTNCGMLNEHSIIGNECLY